MNQELTDCQIKLFCGSPKYQVNQDAIPQISQQDQDEDSKMDNQLGVHDEESILEEEKQWARSGKINKLLQELEDEFDECSKVLDQHIQDIKEDKPKRKSTLNLNSILKGEDINFQEEPPLYTLADKEEIDVTLPQKRISVHPNMHCSLPELTNQNKRRKIYDLCMKSSAKKEVPPVKDDQQIISESKQNSSISNDYTENILEIDIDQTIKNIGRAIYNPQTPHSIHCNQLCIDSCRVENITDLFHHLEKVHNIWPCRTCGKNFDNKWQRKKHRASTCIQMDFCQICKPSQKERSEKTTDRYYKQKNSCRIRCQVPNCQFETCDEVKLKHHFEISHHFIQTQETEFILSTEITLKQLSNEALVHSLKNIEALPKQCKNPRMAKKILRTSQIQSLFVVTNGVAVFKLDFQMVNQQYYRAPLIIVNNWENIDPKLFGISVSALAYKLRFQRVTQILCYLPREYIELGQLLSFFATHNEILRDDFTRLENRTQGKILCSKVVINAMANLVPKVEYPLEEIDYLPAVKVARIIDKWRKSDLKQVLIDHINAKPKKKSGAKGRTAIKSDQAETPPEVFQAIYNCISITRDQMWDPCLFQTDWHHKTHYNGLTNLWQGNFIFCNPPYSIGAKFVSKCLIEFMRGKNIIMLIPQQTANGAFGKKYLKTVAKVKNLGQVKFVNFTQPLQTSVSLVYLLQPDVLQYTYQLRKAYRQKESDIEVNKQIWLSSLLATYQQRFDIAQALIKARVHLSEVRNITRINYSSLQQASSLIWGGYNKLSLPHQ